MAFANSAKAQARQKKEQAKAQVKERLKKSLSDSDDSEALKRLTPKQVDKVVTQALPGAMAVTSSEPSAPAPVGNEPAPTPGPEKPAPEKPPAKAEPDIEGAAKALFVDGEVQVPTRLKERKGFLAEYHLTAQDVAAVEKRLNEMRAADKAKKPAAPVYDLSDPAQRPTTGGMSEDDAATVAELNGWWEAGIEWKCSDTAHTPKGRVYTDGKSYFGADNTGHVGWGFKVWTPKKKGVLDYAGNTVWDGPTKEWKYIKRGT